LRNFWRSNFAQFLPPPSLGIVVTAGHSAGMGAVRQLILDAPPKPPPLSRTWADETRSSYVANPTEFITQWREVWDLDGSANVIGSVGSWTGVLSTWMSANGHAPGGKSDRIARCYHTTYTGWSAQSIDACASLVGKPLPSYVQPPQSVGQKARELEGETGTAVWFADDFLASSVAPNGWDPKRPGIPDEPNFWSGAAPGPVAHTAVLKICFAHAAANSLLRKL
jgi:hypothetical protein